MTPAMYHLPVLCAEAVEFLLTDTSRIVVDGTTGGGGHAERICERLLPGGRLVCFDADADALAASQQRLARFLDRVTFVHANFRNLNAELHRLGIDMIDGLLLDLGVSSHQLDEASRGFSYRADEPLDMRMDRRQVRNAREVLNSYTEEQLAEILWRFGEERASRRIASRIVASRPVETTGDLASVVRRAVGGKDLVKSLARVFQAIRIEVNDELGSLAQVLNGSLDVLAQRGRLVVISYHSLEDRIVKEFFREEAAASIPSGHKLVPDTPRIPRLRILTRRPVEAGTEEMRRNGRARSARLRAAERIGREQ